MCVTRNHHQQALSAHHFDTTIQLSPHVLQLMMHFGPTPGRFIVVIATSRVACSNDTDFCTFLSTVTKQLSPRLLACNSFHQGNPSAVRHLHLHPPLPPPSLPQGRLMCFRSCIQLTYADCALVTSLQQGSSCAATLAVQTSAVSHLHLDISLGRLHLFCCCCCIHQIHADFGLLTP